MAHGFSSDVIALLIASAASIAGVIPASEFDAEMNSLRLDNDEGFIFSLDSNDVPSALVILFIPSSSFF